MVTRHENDSRQTAIEIGIRTAIAAIPYAGGPILEIVNGLAQRRAQERLYTIFSEMKDCLDDLDEEKIDREFFESEEFQTLLYLILEKLHTTHDEERLKMFGHALVNSGSIDFQPDDKEQYIRVLRELSLRDLTVLSNELLRGWTAHVRTIEYPPEVMSSLYRLQGMGLVLEILKEKEAPRGRTGSDRLDGQIAMAELLTKPPKRTFHISEFGARFLHFISTKPNSPEASDQ